MPTITQASLPAVTTGIISGLLPITTDNTRQVLGGTLQLSLNTANIWATTFSGTNFYGGTHSGGTFLATALTCGTLQGLVMGTGGSIRAIGTTGVVGQFLYVSGGNTYAFADTSGGGGSVNIKQTEIDFGTTPVSEASFTIIDADVGATSQIIGNIAYEAPTGKDLDEVEMDDLQIRCQSGAGQFVMFVKTADSSYLHDKFKINYLIG